MTEYDKILLTELDNGIISKEAFLKRFSIDINKEVDSVSREVKAAIETGDPDEIELVIVMILFSSDLSKHIDVLNELLINPNHRSHQRIAKALQDRAPSPSTVPYVRKILESEFDFLEYTCSEPGTIAKWFSWLLFSIGTPEAMMLMKEYSTSSDEGIADEMRYRLSKL